MSCSIRGMLAVLALMFIITPSLARAEELTVNAKSLMGVLSAELRDGQAVTILAEGPDEAQAVCTLSKMLGA